MSDSHQALRAPPRIEGALVCFFDTLEHLSALFRNSLWLTQPDNEDKRTSTLGEELLQKWAQPFQLFLQAQPWATEHDSAEYSKLRDALASLKQDMHWIMQLYHLSAWQRLREAASCLVSPWSRLDESKLL